MISLDWSEYASDGQSRIAINLITEHGRATPLVWQTVNSPTSVPGGSDPWLQDRWLQDQWLQDQWCGPCDINAWVWECHPYVWTCIERFLRLRGVDLEYGKCDADKKWHMGTCNVKSIPAGALVLLGLPLLFAPELIPLARAALLRLAPAAPLVPQGIG